MFMTVLLQKIVSAPPKPDPPPRSIELIILDELDDDPKDSPIYYNFLEGKYI